MKKNKKILSDEAPINDAVKLRGFFRLKLGTPDSDGVVRAVDGDTGWFTNTITNLGKDQYLSQLLGAMAGSKQVSYVALGTGGTLNATATALPGELSGAAGLRTTVTASTVNASGTLNFQFTWNSGNANLTGNISNIALFNISNVTSGQPFAGNTYTSSALASNQAVNGTWNMTRHILATIFKKLREFGGTLRMETIPSRAFAF
ncbi:MAG: hypothetical protein ACYDBV_12760 [Nitrospiria bacterium]